jgi:hypothetical protein
MPYALPVVASASATGGSSPPVVGEIAHGVVVALLTLSACGHVASLDEAGSLAMAIVCAIIIGLLAWMPFSRQSSIAVAVFSTGVAITHLIALPNATQHCGCFGRDVPHWLELYLIALFLLSVFVYIEVGRRLR